MENRINVQLTSRALKDLQKIRDFNDDFYGVPKSKEIIERLFKLMEIFENPNADFTEIGAIDDDFVHLKFEYQSCPK